MKLLPGRQEINVFLLTFGGKGELGTPSIFWGLLRKLAKGDHKE
jgi:hypothetical protein